MKLQQALFSLAILITPQPAPAQQDWLSDEQARELAKATVHAAYPDETCFNTYRQEYLEDWVLSKRRAKLAGLTLNQSIFFYKVISDSCTSVKIENGRPEVLITARDHEGYYGIIAVDRQTKKTYWFVSSRNPDSVFRQLVKDEELVLDVKYPTLFFALYEALVLGPGDSHELTSLLQLQSLVEENFESAWSPYQRDEKWKPKFDKWWRRFRSHNPDLTLETTTAPAPGGIIIRGYSFQGFFLTVPLMDPPPRGTPTLTHWAYLLKSDGTVQRLPSKTVYAAR